MGGMVEYGCPHVEYSVKGKVVDAHTGLGIQGISITLDQTSIKNASQEDGSFEVNCSVIGGGDKEFIEALLEARDVDGSANGDYLKRQLNITLQKDPTVESKNWFRGLYRAEEVVVELEPNENPVAHYTVSGRVVSQDNEPIRGIRVAFDENHTTLTDSEGRFSLADIEIPGDPQCILLLLFEDIDGLENGGWFGREEVEVAFNPDYKDDRILTAEDVLVMMEQEQADAYGCPYTTYSAKEAVSEEE